MITHSPEPGRALKAHAFGRELPEIRLQEYGFRSTEQEYRVSRAVASRSDRMAPELARELEEIAAGQGCELLAVELKGPLLRLILDRPEGGVTLADCEAVSRETSALLDVMDFGPGRYTLEVSSPGLDRELYGPRDYERFTDHRVRVTYRTPDTNARRTVTGCLTAFRPANHRSHNSEDGGEIEVVTDEREERLTIPLSRIQVARLVIEL